MVNVLERETGGQDAMECGKVKAKTGYLATLWQPRLRYEMDGKTVAQVKHR
jgi:hypothetical protein